MRQTVTPKVYPQNLGCGNTPKHIRREDTEPRLRAQQEAQSRVPRDKLGQHIPMRCCRSTHSCFNTETNTSHPRAAVCTWPHLQCSAAVLYKHAAKLACYPANRWPQQAEQNWQVQRVAAETASNPLQ
jgi:hypothetical protein